jgi:hypothetical protein
MCACVCVCICVCMYSCCLYARPGVLVITWFMFLSVCTRYARVSLCVLCVCTCFMYMYVSTHDQSTMHTCLSVSLSVWKNPRHTQCPCVCLCGSTIHTQCTCVCLCGSTIHTQCTCVCVCESTIHTQCTCVSLCFVRQYACPVFFFSFGVCAHTRRHTHILHSPLTHTLT